MVLMNIYERKYSQTFCLKPARGNIEFPCGELAEVGGLKNVSLKKRRREIFLSKCMGCEVAAS